MEYTRKKIYKMLMQTIRKKSKQCSEKYILYYMIKYSRLKQEKWQKITIIRKSYYHCYHIIIRLNDFLISDKHLSIFTKRESFKQRISSHVRQRTLRVLIVIFLIILPKPTLNVFTYTHTLFFTKQSHKVLLLIFLYSVTCYNTNNSNSNSNQASLSTVQQTDIRIVIINTALKRDTKNYIRTYCFCNVIKYIQLVQQTIQPIVFLNQNRFVILFYFLCSASC
eukprot:TRINITY_DN10508_c0_g1_i7.p2 TRINITY_DN10508_c0_g1~~TRINITY_DN10508_c0_g1_i7.p2  ORF type:complete len:223 (-),score=-30.34 TRINITY_DN10508_c0_g1_i7:1789-2457(-)